MLSPRGGRPHPNNHPPERARRLRITAISEDSPGAHAALGRTTDTARLLVDGLADRQSLYVGLSRGRQANYAYCITQSPRLADVAPGSRRAQKLERAVRLDGTPATSVRFAGSDRFLARRPAPAGLATVVSFRAERGLRVGGRVDAGPRSSDRPPEGDRSSRADLADRPCARYEAASAVERAPWLPRLSRSSGPRRAFRRAGRLETSISGPRWTVRSCQMVHRASVGDRRAARMAGSSPARAPTTRAAARPPAHAWAGITVGSPWLRA
jgi:hypothetical protein